MPAICGKPPRSGLRVQDHRSQVPFGIHSMVARSRLLQERENRSTSGVVRGSVGTAQVWSDSQRAMHRSGDEPQPVPEPLLHGSSHFSDETVADAVRMAVLETLDRHGITAERRDQMALDLRARILAVLFCELPPTVEEDSREAEPPIEALETPSEPLVVPVAPWALLTPGETPIEKSLHQRLRALETNHSRWPEVSRLLIEVVLRTGGPDGFDPAMLETETSGLLRRRIAKLERALAEARAAVDRVSGMETIDPGLASIYRGVQGLSVSDPLREAKRDMLELVYRANVALQRRAG